MDRTFRDNRALSAFAKYWTIKTIWPLFAATVILIQACTSPSFVRHGNKNEYIVRNTSEKTSKPKTDDDTGAQEELSFKEDLEALKKSDEARENELATGGVETKANGITQQEADEISELTKQLISNRPENGEVTKTGLGEQKAVAGLPTLQNQIDALRETFAENSEKIEKVEIAVSDIKSEIKELKENIADIKTSITSIEKKPETNLSKPAPKKEIKGYKILSDEELAAKKKSQSSATRPETKKPAEESPTEIVKDSKTDGSLNSLRASMQYKVAMNSLSRKDYKNALIQLRKLEDEASSGSEKAEIAYWQGEAAYGMKDYRKALTYFESSSGRSGSGREDNASAMVAECYIKLGRISEAKKQYRDFIAEYPSSSLVPRARKMLQQL